MKRVLIGALLLAVLPVAHVRADCGVVDGGDRSTVVMEPGTTSYTVNLYVSVDGDGGLHLSNWERTWFVDADADGASGRMDNGTTGERVWSFRADRTVVCAEAHVPVDD